jgi:hypothetical protein
LGGTIVGYVKYQEEREKIEEGDQQEFGLF